jgi:nucleotide-binding universal stress UspA family protein
MYKHILIPTDGSKLSAKGVKAGIRLAKALGARVTALHVIPPYLPVMYAGLDGHVQGESRRNFKTNSERAAELSLAAVEREARAAGVRCSKRFTTDPEPWGGILRTARAAKCDAIVMASHGRSALGGLILGSETQRVLAHSKLPVLVAR